MLDLSRVLAGPFAGRMLSDLGADVVKVEPPEGDVTRTFGRRRGRQTAYFTQQNAGKRGICVDLGAEGGPDLIRRLAAEADIVVENFRPGVLARFGLDWAALSADHPELIMLSISGFGQDGPEVGRAAYAGVMHAESGLLARQSTITGSRADDLQLSVADTNAGLHGLVALLSALRVRDATGVGQHVDIAMIDALLVCDDYVNHAFEGGRARRGGGEVWDTPHGGIIVMGEFKWVWKCANERLGLADPTPPGAELDEKIRLRRQAWADYVRSFPTREDLLAALDRANLAWGLVKTAEEAVTSPTLAHRNSLVEVPDPHEGVRTVVQSPYRFSSSESGVQGPAPALGADNAAVLGDWLGIDPADVDALEQARVLRRDSTTAADAATGAAAPG